FSLSVADHQARRHRRDVESSCDLTSHYFNSSVSFESGFGRMTNLSSVSETIRPETSSPLFKVKTVVAYCSETTFDGSMIDSRMSRREKRLDTAVSSGPTAPPSLPKRWQIRHCTPSNTSFHAHNSVQRS